MTIHPMLAQVAEAFAPILASDWSVMQAPMLRSMLDNPMAVGPELTMARVENLQLELEGRTLNARLYVPRNAPDRPSLTLFFHGGGWVVGTLDTHDATCRALAQASGTAILSIAYRLAPEHRYPAAAEDGYDACIWATRNAAALGVEAEGLAVAGDSAGANVAAAAAILMRDRGGPALRHQLLLYPVTDADFTRPSYRVNGSGSYMLSTAWMQWFWRQYLGDIAPADAPLAALLQTADVSGLPPTTVLTAEYDPLRDEGEAYAARLQAAGVPTVHDCAPGMIHGFFSMLGLVSEIAPYVELAGAALADGTS